MTAAGSEGFRRVALLDTSIASTNVGDEIIMDAVDRALAPLLADARLFRIASHETMSAKSRSIIRRCDFAIAGGSNLLSSHAAFRSVWKLSPLDAGLGPRFVMMGVGWYHDQADPDPVTRWLYRSMFSRRHLHSVRDDYTRKKLAAIGITNVLNTGCPTLWLLPEDIGERIPRAKAARVITTVNTYMKDREADARFLRMLESKYQQVSAWIQTDSDAAYLRDIAPRVQLIAPNLAAYDAALGQAGAVDYVGNRLHAGIRAMQHGRRTLIIEIDNRAREMGADFGLPTVARQDFGKLEHLIETPFENKSSPPRGAVRQWLEQWRLSGEASAERSTS